MKRLSLRWLAHTLLLLAPASGCGGDSAPVTVRLQLAGEPDPLAGVERVRLRVEGQGLAPRSADGPLSAGVVELDPLPLGSARVITAEGLDGAGVVLARGRSAPFELTADSPAIITLFFGRVDSFSIVPPRLAQPRYGHSTTLLEDGRLVVAGGFRADGTPLNSVEIVDPVSGQVSAAPPLQVPRGGHHAVRSGSLVVLVGGVDAAGEPLAAVELYRPDSGTQQTLQLAQARLRCAVAALPDGRVLIAGGATSDNRSVSRTEIVDPGAGTVQDGPDRGPDGAGLVAVALADGRVLAAGGLKDPPGKAALEAKLYDPAGGGSWDQLPHRLPDGMIDARATLLPGGEVFIAGGHTDSGPALSPVLYQGSAGFSAVGTLQTPRIDHDVAPLPDGALIAGGADSQLVERLKGGQLSSVGQLNRPRQGLTLTALGDGTVMAIGGRDGATAHAELERYVPR